MCVVALLIAYAAMSYTASFTKGVSFDEGQQLAVGYNIWLNDDYRIEGANGDFIKRWATLPFLLSRPNFVGRDDPHWQRGEAYQMGNRFFFGLGNQPEALLWQGRAMVVLLGVATGWLVFAWSRALFGTAGGLVALVVFASSPHMLALGGIVSTDMSITLFLLASVGCVWRLLHEVTLGRVGVSLAVVGLLVLTKLSALVIVPITAILVLVKFVAREPTLVRWRSRQWRLVGWHPQAMVVAVLVLLHGLSGWTAIWAHYGFRYAASPEAGAALLPVRAPAQRATTTPAAAVTAWARRVHFFPEGFQVGLEELLATTAMLPSFMGGDWRVGGWHGFFPYAIWVKTRPALMLLLVLSGAAWWLARSKRSGAAPGAGATTAYALVPHLALVGTFLVVAVVANINIGHRHVLPIYPSLFVLAGGAAGIAGGWWGRAAVAMLVAWMVRDSLAVRPHYLAYFGQQAGGPQRGYTHLVDSSLDWGMDLPELKRWLDEHNRGGKEAVFLGYFGTDSPSHHGIKARRLPGFFERKPVPEVLIPLLPGYYAISASLLQGVYTGSFGPWTEESERTYRTVLQNLAALNQTKPGTDERRRFLDRHPGVAWATEHRICRQLRFARLCAWLRHQGAPPHHVGHTIFIWKLNQESLHAALLGPPVERADQRMILWRL